MSIFRHPALSILILLAALPAVTATAGFAAETILQNDSFVPGQAVGFQSGFVAGEAGAVRLTPPGPFPMTLTRVQFLFGGATGTRTVTVRVWNDSAGTPAPGAELYSGDFQITAADDALQEIDLSGSGVQVTGVFRVGIEFQHDGTPSIARDANGITSARNFIYAQGLGWVDSALFGLTGDWVIRAGVQPSSEGGESGVVQNDSFAPGQSAAFQSGFVTGETAAARLVPPGPFPLQVNAVRFLFGGAVGTRTITLHIWDDPGGAVVPGTELYSGDYEVVGADDALQEIDLTTLDLVVAGPFRVGIEFQHDGAPSVARDNGLTAGRNFVDVSGLGWVGSETLGVAGDWIIRAVVGAPPVTGPGQAAIISIADIAGDQGRSVRVRFARSDQDAPGAATPITSYGIYRRVDPLKGAAPPDDPGTLKPQLDGWDYVSGTPAHGESVYSLVVPTLADSSIAAGQRWSVFLVRAATSSPYLFFDSVPDSGWSVDNLAPGVPAGLALTAGTLSWSPSTAADFDYFSLYGSASATFDGTAVLIDRTTGTSVALGGGPTHPYYHLTATDFAGNEGRAAVAAATSAVDGPGTAARWALTAWPNPFNPRVAIVFELADVAAVTLDVYALDGTLVRRLTGGVMTAGRHDESWDGRDADGRDVAAGAYLARLRAGERTLTQRLLLVR